MNYNPNTFVISVGEHLAAITYGAPWMNGNPINHAQAYMIFSAVHEELVNEMFSWAKIDNSVQRALQTVYQGYQIFEPAAPKLLRFVVGQGWQMVDSKALTANDYVQDVQKLPSRTRAYPGLYRLHGGVRYAEWLDAFVYGQLEHVKNMLRDVMNRYMGTARDYEWWFEYAGNGILYTRQQQAIPGYVEPPKPESEAELISQEIDLLPKVAAGEQTVVLDITGFESHNHLIGMLQRLPTMYMEACNRVMMSGAQKMKIHIKYVNPANLRSVVSTLGEMIQAYSLPLEVTVESEQIDPQWRYNEIGKQSLDRRLLNESVSSLNQQSEQDAATLTEIRNRVIRRNSVTDMDMREIQLVSPGLLSTVMPHDDICRAVNDRDQLYKFNGVNPVNIDPPLLPLILCLSNQIDQLNGYVPANEPVPVYKVEGMQRKPATTTPVFTSTQEIKPLSTIALFGN